MNRSPNVLNYLLGIQIVLLLALFLASSGCRLGHKKTLYIDDRLAPYVTSFVNSAAMEGKPLRPIDDLVVQFVPFMNDTSVLAVCRSGYNVTPVINVSAEKWPYLTNAGREQLLFHELGHCVLDRRHDDSMVAMPTGVVPRSLMISYQIPDSVYIQNHQYYIHELFSH